VAYPSENAALLNKSFPAVAESVDGLNVTV
jgi:hypothetical protein